MSNTPYRILIVDDDAAMRDSLNELLTAAGWHTITVSRATTALERLADARPDVVLSDVCMPGMSGLDLTKALQDANAPPIVLISAHGDIPTAVDAVRDGAYSFIEKPYDPHRLLSVLKHAAEQHRMAIDTERLRQRLSDLSGLDRILLGEDEDVRALRRTIIDYAQTDAAVLLVGETGTGKELVARALHDLGPRAAAPFVAINTAALSSDTFEAEMFGRGEGQRGRLREADGGTLFLDEIALCPLDVQARLLRVAETGIFYPVGSDTPVQVDMRIISASSEIPLTLVEAGLLRTELLYRLNALHLHLPPLRQRPGDTILLHTHFVQHYATLYRSAPPVRTPEDTAILVRHTWPGNVRELRGCAERWVLANRSAPTPIAAILDSTAALQDLPMTLREAVAVFEREVIGHALKTHSGRMDPTAEALGIGRRTLNEKIVKLGLDKDDWID